MRRLGLLLVALLVIPGAASASGFAERPWLNPRLSPEQRATLLLKEMTQGEKFHYLSTYFGARFAGGPARMDRPPPPGARGTPGFVPALPRLGLPALYEVDGPGGIGNPNQMRPGDTATPLPAPILIAATWDPNLAFEGGAMIGDEARAKGFNILLAGGVDLAREPRNGRTYEYVGEDPLLAGVIVGAAVRGIQSRHVISTVKHFAMNDQETGRSSLNAVIGRAAMRESDLLAFEIAIEQGNPGSVMCAYNSVNGVHACENDYLLNKTLKQDWGYKGWVMSDFGGVHSAAKAALAGLDQESAFEIDDKPYFREPLARAVQAGEVPESRINDMVRRVLTAMVRVGIIDHPVRPGGKIDAARDGAVALKIAEQGIVLLKNRTATGRAVLPISRDASIRIAVIGGHADAGVLSGSAGQVIPIGGPALVLLDNKPVSLSSDRFRQPVTIYDPSSPLVAIRQLARKGNVMFDDGSNIRRAAEVAKQADVAIVFAVKHAGEGRDNVDLKLPFDQDALITAVATANPHTVVVLETGNPVTMPWLDRASAVLEAWYPGARGGEAIANVLFGLVDPSGKLPVTFPRSVDQLPDPASPTRWLAIARKSSNPFQGNPFDVHYTEGAAVGYKWYASRNLTPLFPFGFGLSYTRFVLERLKVSGGVAPRVQLRVKNTGAREGAEVAQVYAIPPGASALPRLVGWQKVALLPGQSQTVSFTVDPRLLADFDVTLDRWRIRGGNYVFRAGDSFMAARLKAASRLRTCILATRAASNEALGRPCSVLRNARISRGIRRGT